MARIAGKTLEISVGCGPGEGVVMMLRWVYSVQVVHV